MKPENENGPGARSAKRVTLDDIARRVKVSRATISLALNDKGTLPASRREEIKRVAAELNYVPNPLAQALRGGKTRSIGVVTNYFSNIYFRDFYIGLEEVADARGFTFMVSQAYESLEKERRQVAKFSEYGVDGMIVLPCSRERDHLFAVSNLEIPVVLISNTLGTDFPAVIPDNIRGTKMAVRNLLEFDDRPMLHIAGPQEQSSQRQRRDTFIRTLRQERPAQSMDKAVYQAEGLRSLAGYAAMDAILRDHKPPFSLFVCNDEITTGVIRYAAEHSLRLPEDIAIACFSGDTSFCTLGVPVSVVTVQAKRMGETTARLLLDLIDRPEERESPPQITLPVMLHDNLIKPAV